MADRYWVYLMEAMWTIVVAVADMNWPDHMGGGGHLLTAIGIL